MLMYAAFQAVHSTCQPLDSLLAMGTLDLVTRFGDKVVAKPTACDLTMPYSPDLCANSAGIIAKDCEDIQRSLCGIQIRAQGRREPYMHAPTPPSLAACADAMPHDPGPGHLFGVRVAPALCADDCENQCQVSPLFSLNSQKLAEAGQQVAMCFHKCLAALYNAYSTKAARPVEALAADMLAARDAHPALFSALSDDHIKDMATVLHRLGKAAHCKRWTLDLAVVSAKGPQADMRAADPPELCGHGAGLSVCVSDDGKKTVFTPSEGTTYLVVDAPFPDGFADRLTVSSTNIDTGASSSITLTAAQLQTILAQNMHTDLGFTHFARMQAHLQQTYENPLVDCPFYVSVFYSGMQASRHASSKTR